MSHCDIPLFLLMIFLLSFVLSIPVHEIGHYLFILIFGGRTSNLEINLLKVTWRPEITLSGSVDAIGGFYFPVALSPYKRLVAFFFGLSGGLFSGIIMLTLAGTIVYNTCGTAYCVAVAIPGYIELIYGIWEAFQSVSPKRLHDIQCIL